MAGVWNEVEEENSHIFPSKGQLKVDLLASVVKSIEEEDKEETGEGVMLSLSCQEQQSHKHVKLDTTVSDLA